MRLLPILTALAPVAALAQPAPPVTWGELFSPDRVITSLAQTFIGFTRSVTYLTYADLSLDLRGGSLTLTEAVLRPFPDAHPMSGCTIRVDRLRLAGVPLEVLDRAELDLMGEGLDISLGCLPRDLLPFAAASGVDSLRADLAAVGLAYDQPSSGLVATVQLDLPGLAQVSGHAEFDYVGAQMPRFGQEPLPLGDLARAQISLVDQGAWDIARRMLPADALAPNALAFGVSQMLTDLFESWGTPPGGQPRPLSATQREFIQEAAGVMRRLPDGPREVVLTLTPDPAPLRLSEQALFGTTPGDLFDAMGPRLRLGLVDQVALLPTDLLATAFDDPGSLSDTARRAVGLAMLRGAGAPYAPGPGQDLIAPLLDGDDTGGLHFALADALAAEAPSDAYAVALEAAARGAPGALSLLDRLERQIGLTEAVILQPLTPAGPGEARTRAEFARNARAAMVGQGVPRSYVSAAYWAGLASAAGDASAARLRHRLDSMMTRGGHRGWLEQVIEVDDQVLDDWIVHDIPSRLSAK